MSTTARNVSMPRVKLPGRTCLVHPWPGSDSAGTFVQDSRGRQPMHRPSMGEYDVEQSQGMHVVHDGPRQAPPLLLIHGSGASGGSWSPVVPALAGHHHVIRVDLPGCGQSPPAPSYDVPAQAGRVAALLDDLGLRHVTVVGHSSGGYVATALAEQRPDLVRSLALISTGPSPDALLPQPFILRVLLAPPLGPLLWSRRSDAMIRRGISATAARPVDIPDDLVAEVRGITYRAMQDGAAPEHRVHRRAERARASRRPRRPGAGDLRRCRPAAGSRRRRTSTTRCRTRGSSCCPASGTCPCSKRPRRPANCCWASRRRPLTPARDP